MAHAFEVCNDCYSVWDVFEIYENNIGTKLIMITRALYRQERTMNLLCL